MNADCAAGPLLALGLRLASSRLPVLRTPPTQTSTPSKVSFKIKTNRPVNIEVLGWNILYMCWCVCGIIVRIRYLLQFCGIINTELNLELAEGSSPVLTPLFFKMNETIQRTQPLHGFKFGRTFSSQAIQAWSFVKPNINTIAYSRR